MWKKKTDLWKELPALLLSILLAQAAGIIGSVFTVQSIPTWYAALDKPFFSPPNWIFGPVWITLYCMMGVAAYLVWRHRKELGARKALYLYAGHLVVNTLWSTVFFGAQQIGPAFGVITILWVMILALIVHFYVYNRWASLLLVPYVLWVTFAALLNAALWFLNA